MSLGESKGETARCCDAVVGVHGPPVGLSGARGAVGDASGRPSPSGDGRRVGERVLPCGSLLRVLGDEGERGA